ncbi:MAG: glycosyltransferase family 4 protein [Actinomycetota bacterium]|nr:glycosyltransferase family 4 protein [Actinomycetota bacterium]
MTEDLARPRLIFATRRPPFPLDNGARIRSYRLLTGLAESFSVTLVTFEHHEKSPDGLTTRADLESILPGVEVVAVPGVGPSKRRRQARSLLARSSWAWGQYASAALRATLKQLVAERKAAIIHFDDLGVALCGPLPGPRNVYSAHNVEHRVARQVARTGSPVRTLFGAADWRKIRAEEERVWRSMDLCLAVSDVDAEVMRAGGAHNVAVCPNGVDPVAPLPPPQRHPGEPLRLVFVGSGSYRPYERGIAWLVSEVLPRVKARLPVALDVVGRPPQRPVAAEGVRYVGVVPAVEPWYEASHVAVVPVFEGSGTRLKVVEALAYGRPVVSTRMGAEGLPLEPGRHFLQADDAVTFTDALLRVADQTETAGAGLEAMLATGRAAVAELVWPRIVENLVDRYRAEAARLTGGLPAPD